MKMDTPHMLPPTKSQINRLGVRCGYEYIEDRHSLSISKIHLALKNQCFFEIKVIYTILIQVII